MRTTPFARKLGVELPIFSAPMGGGTAGPALTAAVSNAGGCGLLGLGGVPAPAAAELIAAARAATARPFGEGSVVGRYRLGPDVEEVPRYSMTPPLASFEGDHELAALYAGQSCGLVDDVSPAARILRDLVREADRALARCAPGEPRRARTKRAQPKRRPRRRAL